MAEKRKMISTLQPPVRFKFLRIVMLFLIVSFIINAYVSIKTIQSGNFELSYLAYQLNFGAIVIILLISLTFIMHRGFGALSRIENVLEEVSKGDCSLRITLRKGDVLIPLVERINKIIEQLEKSSRR
ncbi:MAG: hypothetical protein ABH865_06760 [Candidatus Omnitrophota bacterium]|nr:hypothetical protein [Candidatus Omnitrophota bacterium]